jgi:signal transduction histidine kinase/ligand-binding sensor domain-containing protein
MMWRLTLLIKFELVFKYPACIFARIFAATTACFFIVTPAWCQSKFSDEARLHFEHFSTHDGLSDNNVIALFQDSRGLLWVGTENGLNYFDGKNFTAFYPSNFTNSKLQNDEIKRVAEDADHNIIFYNDDGLFRLEWGTKLIRMVLSNAGMDMKHRVLDFFIDLKKNVWTISETSLDEYDAHFHMLKRWALNTFDSKGFRLAKFAANDQLNNLWFWYNGLLHVVTQKNQRYFFDEKAYVKLLNLPVESIALDTLGNYWVLTRHKLLLFDKISNKLTLFYSSEILNRSIQITKSGAIWIFSWFDGLFVFDAHTKKIERFRHDSSDPDSPATNFSNIVFQDKRGDIWIGNGIGLDKSVSVLNNFRVKDDFGIAKNGKVVNKLEIQSLSIYKDKVLIPTSYGEFMLDGRDLSMMHYRADEKYASQRDNYRTNFMLNDHQLMASHEKGITLFDLKNKKLIPSSFPVPHPALLDSATVVSVYEDRGNNVWFGMIDDYGIITWDRTTNQFTHYGQNEKARKFFPLRHFTAAAEDDEGNIVMGYDKGGIQVFNKRSQTFTSLPIATSDPLNKERFNCMLNDHEGHIWMATWDGVVEYSMTSHTYKSFAKRNGLISAEVFALAFDRKGRLWLGSRGSGISCFDAKTQHFINYTHTDGVPDDEIYNLVFDTGSNRMYFTTSYTLGFFDPERVTKIEPTLVPLVTSFKVQGKEKQLSGDKPVEVPFYENFFSFNYTAANFINPADTRYMFMLKGFDTLWRIAGSRQYVDYTNLPPGNYQFKLRATTGRKWFEMKSPVAIHITVPFYKTIWFLVMIAFSIFVSSALVILYAQRTQLQRILTAQKIRDDIAGDLHDDIGSSLSSIMLMSEIARKLPAEAADYLSQITETAGNVIERMNDIVWAVNPGNDSVEQMLARMQEFASGLLEKKNITLQFNTTLSAEPLKPDMEQRKNLYLIFKEAVHNAFKYADCSQVTVTLILDGKTISLKVEDDGKGFDSTKKYMGNGLYNMQKRAAEIKSSVQVRSAPGSGTAILFVLKTTQTGS